METTEKAPRQMANSGDNKARRPLPPLPHQDFNTGLTPSNGDDDDPDTHMYNYVDKDEINRQLSLRQTNSNDGQPSGEGTDRRQVTVGRNVVGFVHNQMYGAVASRQEDNRAPRQMAHSGNNKARRPLPPLPQQGFNTGMKTETTTEGHVHNNVDTDGISNLRQQLDDPAVTDRKIPGLIENKMYVRGALRQDTNDATNICRFLTSCKRAFRCFCPFIIIAIAVLAVLGAGASIGMYLTGTLGGPAEINMPSVVTDGGNWTTTKPVTTTVTAAYVPVTLKNTAFLSATKLHQATNMFPPSNKTATKPIPTAQATCHDVVRTRNLPQVTSTLPHVATTLPQVTTTLPQVTTKPPKMSKCTNGYQLLAQTCIRIYDDEKTYLDALLACEKDGATLAMPKTRELDVALRNLIIESFEYWIGLVKCDYNWKWADGSFLSNYMYKGWGPYTEGSMKFDCGRYWSYPTGTPMWYDTDCCLKLRFICQATQSPLPKKSGGWFWTKTCKICPE